MPDDQPTIPPPRAPVPAPPRPKPPRGVPGIRRKPFLPSDDCLTETALKPVTKPE